MFEKENLVRVPLFERENFVCLSEKENLIQVPLFERENVSVFLLYLDLYWSSCPAHFDVEVSPALDKAMASDAVDVSSGNILLFF